MKEIQLIDINTMPAEKVKFVRPNKNNFWLLELMYGDAAYDRTSKFQIPCNLKFKSL